MGRIYMGIIALTTLASIFGAYKCTEAKRFKAKKKAYIEQTDKDEIKVERDVKDFVSFAKRRAKSTKSKVELTPEQIKAKQEEGRKLSLENMRRLKR